MRKLPANMLLFVLAAAATPLCAADEASDTAPIIAALVDVAKDADEQVRYVAFDVLKEQPRSDQLLELFWQGIEDDSLQIRTLSLDKIVELEGPTDKVLKQLISLVRSRRDPAEHRMAQAAYSHLRSIGAPAIPYLIEALKQDKPDEYVVSLVGNISLGEHRATIAERLTNILKDEDKLVRIAAVRSLQSIIAADAKARADAKLLADTGGVDPRYFAYYTKLLQKYDSNADGSLTKDEWSKMKMRKDPAAADKDQDGKITAAELAKWSLSAPQ